MLFPKNCTYGVLEQFLKTRKISQSWLELRAQNTGLWQQLLRSF